MFGGYVTTKWWPAWEDQHPSSEYGTRKKVEKRIPPTFGDLPLVELDPSTIERWKAAMVAEGLTPRTVHHPEALTVREWVERKHAPVDPRRQDDPSA